MEMSESLSPDFVAEVTNRCMEWTTLTPSHQLCRGPQSGSCWYCLLFLIWIQKQVDYTCAFIHAHITQDVYVHMPRGFEEGFKIATLSLYELRQSPRNFFENLKGYFTKSCFKKLNADPCIFISERFICWAYVDVTLYAAADALLADKSGNTTEPTSTMQV